MPPPALAMDNPSAIFVNVHHYFQCGVTI